jgi:HTH-type transcriptional regulator, sugar sensing transcriptional regulator
MDISLFKKLGFSDKGIRVYMALLQLGSSSVRKLAECTDINRGTIYDILRELQDLGVVSYHNKDTKQKFIVETPEKLYDLLEQKQNELERAKGNISKNMPELQALHARFGGIPIAKYFSSHELDDILEDVLSTCEQTVDKLYRIYSTVGIREFLYKKFQTFSDVRIAKGIEVKVIAVGEGGELRGLDERKWLKVDNSVPTYILMYEGKTAYISLDAHGEPVGVLIENQGVYEMQKNIFEELWKNL